MLKHAYGKKGFSLVELMVVVAIIGILAAIAIPSVSKYMAKARQSEAKTNLSSLYTAEKAFYAEYNTFDNRFAAVGYTPEGQLRYDVGFVSGVTAGLANGYNTAPAVLATRAGTYCGTGTGFQNGCALLAGANSAAVPAVTDAACGGIIAPGGSAHPAGVCSTAISTFRAGAAAQIQSGLALEDRWSIDDLKVLRNTQNGIR